MNLWKLPKLPAGAEVADALVSGKDVLIERIVSCGHSSPPDFWYDQPRDEWVVLLQGEAEVAFADGRLIKLVAGDWLLISAHERHRVTATSSEPPCIWLAVHASLT